MRIYIDEAGNFPRTEGVGFSQASYSLDRHHEVSANHFAFPNPGSRGQQGSRSSDQGVEALPIRTAYWSTNRLAEC
jgi:hypothetical protein